jgi:uncharacterized protein YbbK (DUF523 family)/uncharacterized protein YbgA (DUF1722 family)
MKDFGSTGLPTYLHGEKPDMQRFVKPTVVISKCLGFGICRFDGERLYDPFVTLLKRRVKFLPVCPEVEIGLGMPRDPILIVKSGKRKLLYQVPNGSRNKGRSPRGRGLTRMMNSFSTTFLKSLQEVDGFILKSKSPSCGLRDTALMSETSSNARVVGHDSGLFAESVLRQFPEIPAEDERRLADTDIREHWLTKLFTLAAFRFMKKLSSRTRLAAFHREYRLLLSTYNQTATRAMDRLLANPNNRDFPALIKEYELQLHRALRRKAPRASIIRALQFGLIHYAPHLDQQEKIAYRRSLSHYRERRISLCEIRKVIRIWGVRYDKSFIKAHSFFRPYPEELGEVG